MPADPSDDQNPEEPLTAAVSGAPEDGWDARLPQRLSWSWELDLDALMQAIADVRPAAAGGQPDSAAETSAAEEDQEAVLAARLAAEASGEVRTLPAGEVARLVAERLPVGPGLAALLADVPVTQADDRDLPAIAAGFRRIASWAQAAGLSAVAQIAWRAAASDPKAGVQPGGLPNRVCASAAGEVSLVLVMSQFGATCWTDLAVTLAWRLSATGADAGGGRD